MANSSVLLLIVALVATVFGTVNGLSCNKCGIRTSNQFPNHPECASVPITNPKYFRDEEDCGKFYECNRGTAYEHVCSVGYAFNQQTTYCAPASKVNCSSQAPIASSSCTICQQAKESIHQHPNCRAGSEAHQRPVLFRHEKDCSKYYQCDHGTAYLVQCPAALHFNALTNVCDYPANVDCSGPVIQEQVDGAAGGYPGTNGHQGGRDPSNAPCTICEQATNVLVKHPNCNDNGRFYSPYFRHETDCSKFYQCSHGSAYEIQCPAGLNFNSRINVCDYPHNVDCSGSVIAQANEPSYPGTNGHQGDRTNGHQGGPEQTVRPSYPGTNGHQGGPNESCPICQQAVNVVPAHPRCKAHDGLYFRHETDCSKFFLCNHGTAYEIQCPVGLQYNARIKVCDYPRNVNCSEEGTEQSVRPSYPGTNEHQGGPTESCTICQQAVNVVPAHPRCKANDGLYFRHETDCSNFYYCYHGDSYEIQCPAGLHFNSRANVCDYPSNGDCQEQPSESSSPKSIDTVPGVAIHAIHPKCPAITGDQEPVYWADTRDCTCYFGCQWGCVEEFKCPAGHQWHDSKKVCIEGLSETCQQ